MAGKFIVVDGIDGSGKTAVIESLVDMLINEKGFAPEDVVRIEEPGGSVIADALRDGLVAAAGRENLSRKAEMLLILAARLQVLETTIRPALAEGKWVIVERYELSSRAYQGTAFGLENEIRIMTDSVIRDSETPDMSFLLDVDVPVALERLESAGGTSRFLEHGLVFYEKARSGYLKAIKETRHGHTIDASEPLGKVTERVNGMVSACLL